MKPYVESDVRQNRSGTKTLYLHIGHYKTGTSAIQDYLSRNTAALREHGYLYPTSARPKRNNTNHGHLSLSVARDHGFMPPPWYGEEISADAAYAAFREEVNRASEDNIIVSSEEFVQLALQAEPEKALGDLKERLAGFDVKIVLYIREPFSLLKSWYNQVNKGPVGTRNFTTFFMNLKPQFLAQEAIWRAYLHAFGEENLKVISYKKAGADHIREFLCAINCDHKPAGVVNPVNEAQPIATLELSRLARDRKFSYDEATITSFENVEKFINKVKRVSSQYNEVTARSDENRPSRLTPVSVVDYYGELLTALGKVVPLNQLEADRMRDLALRAENKDLHLAAALMRVAQIIRPNGDLINRRLEKYRLDLDDDHNADPDTSK